ncbi:hypothetical protein KC352_g3616 [Hortaea werneckii]|nr:hypothetical protein KC352_g3616 [Hortaea werneckii]
MFKDNLGRHYRRKHGGDRQSNLEEEKLSDVLEKHGIPEKYWPATPKVLSALPNFRLQPHLPAAFHYPGEERPQVIADWKNPSLDQLRKALPDLKHLVVRLSCSVGSRQYQDGEPIADDFGELWIEGKCRVLDKEMLLEWLANVVEDDERQIADKLLNVQAAFALYPSELDNFRRFRSKLLQRHSVCSDQDPTTTVITISPAQSTVDIHYDKSVVVSTVFLAKAPTLGQPDSSVAKIWIVWPRLHLYTLGSSAKQRSYSGTAHSLKSGEGAMWFEQNDGETVVLPEDMPYATIAVKRCYLIRSAFHGTFVPRAPLILADINTGVAPDEAVIRLVERTKAAFRQPPDLHDQYMHSFLQHLAYNVPALESSSDGCGQLVRTLAEGWLNMSRCGLCKLLGSTYNVRNIDNGVEHANGYLMNFSTPGSRLDGDIDRPTGSNLNDMLPSPTHPVPDRWDHASRRYESSNISQSESRRSKRQRS